MLSAKKAAAMRGEALATLAEYRYHLSVNPEVEEALYLLRDHADELDARIASRAEQMLREGAIEEVAALEGLTLSATASKTLGLTQVQDYLQGRLTRSELASAIALATRQYAKRQRTWLRREKWLTPIPDGAGDTPRSLAEKIAAML